MKGAESTLSNAVLFSQKLVLGYFYALPILGYLALFVPSEAQAIMKRFLAQGYKCLDRHSADQKHWSLSPVPLT